MNRNRWAFVPGVALAVGALFAAPAPRVTVAQVEQFLAAEQAAHAADAQIAQRLLAVELSERLSGSALARISAKYHPGPETADALKLLEDLSEFCDPAADELLRKSAPPGDEQQAMIRSAGSFATETLKHMPDYLATRTTERFEDVPIFSGKTEMQSGLHPVGTSVYEVAYRKGREVSSRAVPGRSAGRLQGPRLESAGEFGPVLATIMTDAAKGKVSWSRWEQTSAGAAAVFDYDVPKEASHYRVDFCCVSESGGEGPQAYHGMPAYHGTLSIDPATGAILRVTLTAEFPGFDPEAHVDLMVEYREVDVGGTGLMCPVRSVATSEAYTLENKRYWRNLYVNEMTFTNYRRFGSTVRVLGIAP